MQISLLDICSGSFFVSSLSMLIIKLVYYIESYYSARLHLAKMDTLLYLTHAKRVFQSGKQAMIKSV